MSNLRSIGQGMQMYALYNRESLPFGDFLDPVGGWTLNSATANWSIRVAAAMNKGAQGDNFMLSNTSKGVFKCPTANQDNEAPNEWVLHYACHPRIMPSFSLNNDPLIGKRVAPYKLSKIKGGTDIVLAWDGTQYFNANGLWNGNTHPVGTGVDNSRAGGWGHGMLDPCPPGNSWDNNLDAIVDGGTNKDCEGWTGNQEQIRWRHRKNDLANFLYCDGHVGSLAYKSRFDNEAEAQEHLRALAAVTRRLRDGPCKGATAGDGNLVAGRAFLSEQQNPRGRARCLHAPQQRRRRRHAPPGPAPRVS